jgi:hypothetical protein
MEENSHNILEFRKATMRTGHHSICTCRNDMIQINRTWNTYEKEQGKRFVYEVENVMPTTDRDA